MWRAGLFVIVGAILLAGCQMKNVDGQASSEGETFTIPFLYRGLGAGAMPLTGAVFLEQGEEQGIVSRAILRANQSFDLSVIEPEVELDALIPEGTTWTTDIAPLPPGVISAHNVSAPTTPLELTRIYALSLSGTYQVVGRELRFTVESTLYSRGLGSDFRPYEGGGYSGTFFAELFRKRVQESLAETSTEG